MSDSYDVRGRPIDPKFLIMDTDDEGTKQTKLRQQIAHRNMFLDIYSTRAAIDMRGTDPLKWGGG